MSERDIAKTGLVPIPGDIDAASAVGLVEVEYSSSYRCAICGWKPRIHFGCIPAMKRHLETEHSHRLPEKPLWITGYGNAAIKMALQAEFGDSHPQDTESIEQQLET